MDFLKLSFLIIHRSLKFIKKARKTVMNCFSYYESILVIEIIYCRVRPFCVLISNPISSLNFS